VPNKVTGGQDTVALRVPNHQVALSLLKAFGGGIAAPSANRFCRISPTLASHVEEELGDKVDMILDGGACQVGLESTIVDLSAGQPKLLRPGQISKAEIESVLQQPLLLPEMNEKIHAPGATEVHYAPDTTTILCIAEQIINIQKGITFQHQYKLGVIAYEAEILSDTNTQVVNMPKDANAYAHDLYSTLRKLDNPEVDLILVEQPPQTETWQAVNNRLNKAARKYTDFQSTRKNDSNILADIFYVLATWS
jgi:L-threonylcarbamoyladenylate synthase